MITIHCIHGSLWRKWWETDPRPRTGGLLGGHVVIECGDTICHFDNKNMPISIFYSSRPSNSFVICETVGHWRNRTKNDEITSYNISVTETEYEQMQKIIDQFKAGISPVPYNYSFFGYRCYAFVYDTISRVNVVSNTSKVVIGLYGFVPPLARIVLVQCLKKSHRKYKIVRQRGEATRIWERC